MKQVHVESAKLNISTLLVLVVFIAASLFHLNGNAQDANHVPKPLVGVEIQEKLGNHIDLDLAFTDHTGASRKLRDYVADGKPMLLTLNYYTCPSLCSFQLNALVAGMQGLGSQPTEKFRVVTVSIDPTDTTQAADSKRKEYLSMLGRGENVDWHFLTGAEVNIKKLAASVGFNYNYDENQKQFAHGAAIFFIAKDGKITRYLYGIEYPSLDLKLAAIEASEGRAASALEKIILSCFHYDEKAGRYGPYAMGMVRVGGVLTVLLLGSFLLLLWRRDRIGRIKECLT